MIKNNKGFTLVEILITIALIGLLFGIGIPGIFKIKKNMEKRSNNTKIDLIEQAGILWGQDNKTLLQSNICNIDGEGNNIPCLKITINELIKEDYLEADEVLEDGSYIYINPESNSNIVNNCVYIYKKNNRVYAFYSKNIC